jgi:type I restriction enzyme, S subunit
MPNKTNPTATYKPTNIPWLGDIPSDWEVRRLKFVFKYVTGATPDSGKNSYYSQDGFNWITISDLNGKYTKESKNKITQEGVEKKNMTIVPSGSLLYSFKLSVGQMSFVEVPTYTNEAIFAILPELNLNLDFWYYALESYLIKSANENIYGAKIFNQDSIDNAQLICPPLQTQTTIAKYLDAKSDLIAKYIADKKQIIELLREQKKSLIYNAVTKGLDQNTTLKSSGVEWLGDIPSDWVTVPFSKYFTSMVDYRGKTPEKVPFSNHYLVTTRNIRNGKLNYDESEEYISERGFEESRLRGVPKIGDVLFTMEAPLGECAVIDREDVAFGQRIVKFRLDKNKFDSAFIIYSMTSSYFQDICQSEATGSTVLGLKSSKIHKLKFILPPLQTQQLIVTYLDTQTAIIDDTISKIQREIELIQEYKKSLIYGAVTGKIEI